MKRLSFTVAILSFLLSLTSAKEVSFDEGSVTFVVPDEFTELSLDEIKASYPPGKRQKYVLGTESRETTVAFQLHTHSFPLEESALPDLQKIHTDILDTGMPGIEWIQNATIDLGGHKWLIMELTSRNLRNIDKEFHFIRLHSEK